MKTKLPLILCLVGLAASSGVWLLGTQAQTAQRGQTVRLKVGGKQEVDLYEASYALVIGVSDYTNGWNDLPGVSADLPAVKAALVQQGFEVTTVTNPTQQQLRTAIEQFISAYGQRASNRLLIYFAGHGHTLLTQDGRRQLGYLVPANAPRPTANDSGAFKALAVSMNEINNYAEQIEARHALFVFDSCFAGSIFKSRSGNLPEDINDKILQPVRQFITAGTEKQTVPDYSYFRRAFVAALDGAADVNRDGFITGTELGEYLHREVTNYTKRAQTPQHGRINTPDLNEGDLVFVTPKRVTVELVEPPKPQPVPTPSFDPAALELALWNGAQRNDEVSDYEEYLRQYPNGRFAVSARNRLAKLRPSVVKPPDPKPTPSVRMSATGVALTALPTFTTVKVDDSGKVIEKKEQQECWGYVEDLGNGVKLELVEIPAGEFEMGSADEKPVHKVSVNGFLMGKTEVTQAQWRAVSRLPKVRIDIKADPSKFKGDSLPVEQVSWDEAVEFCARLSRKTGAKYGLPSEAEWEYAARARTTTAFAFGATITPELVNYDGNFPYGQAAKGQYRQKTVPAGSFSANAWGLFDMHGNVWEWCEDDWHGSYENAPSDGRAWVDISARGSYRVNRGGSWNDYAVFCRSANRFLNSPGVRYGDLGFRLVRR